MTVLVLPDVVALTRTYLLSVPEITAIFGQRIATKSAPAPAYPYVTLQRIGGRAPIGERLDSARIQFDAWANPDPTANPLGEITADLGVRTLRAALFAINRSGGFVRPAGVITSATDVLGPAWQPDTTRTPHVPRFTSTLDIGARTP